MFMQDNSLSTPTCLCPHSSWFLVRMPAGNLLQEPVRSPHGHVFEKSAIDACLKRFHCCPLTGQPLTKSELVLDTELVKQIQDWQMLEAQRETTSANTENSTSDNVADDDEEEDPLYVFD